MKDVNSKKRNLLVSYQGYHSNHNQSSRPNYNSIYINIITGVVSLLMVIVI